MRYFLLWNNGDDYYKAYYSIIPTNIDQWSEKSEIFIDSETGAVIFNRDGLDLLKRKDPFIIVSRFFDGLGWESIDPFTYDILTLLEKERVDTIGWALEHGDGISQQFLLKTN